MKINYVKSTLVAALIAQTLFNTGCFNMGKLGAAQSASSTSNSISSSNNPNFAINPNASTAQVTNFRGVLASYKSMTGVTPSTAAVSIYQASAPTYSLNGSPASVNAPAQFSLTKLSAEMCLTLVNNEKAMAATSRSFFNAIDFTQTPSPQFTSGALSDALNRMSRKFCGHNVSSTLASSIQTEIASSASSTVQDTSDAALMTCTAFLSSSCAVINN